MRARLHFDEITMPREEWWRDRAWVGRLFTLFEGAGLWFSPTVVGLGGPDRIEVGSRDDLLSAIADQAEGQPLTLATEPSGREGGVVRFMCREDCLLALSLDPETLDPIRKDVLDRMSAVARGLHAALAESGHTFRRGDVEVEADAFTPRTDVSDFYDVTRWWMAPGQVVNFVSRASIDRPPPDGNRKLLAALTSASVEPPATRDDNAGLITFRWVPDLRQDADVVAGLTRQEAFSVEVMRGGKKEPERRQR
jgi:hypothetical protein